ncbi:hemagglutinin repeat-containing protein [Parasaccharibacter apium]|nr:hemagglutinin repeat-containing protein [Parasaccharibacter apium]
MLANSGELGSRQGAVSLEGTGLRNDGGKLIAADGPLSLTLHGGDISNSNGLIQSSEGLTLTAGTLSNQGGVIQTDRNMSLIIHQYESDAGASLSSRGHLDVQAQGRVHNGGLMGGGAGVDMQATSLENDAQARLVSVGAPLRINLTGQDGLKNAGTVQTQHFADQNSGADLNIVTPVLFDGGTIMSADAMTVMADRVVTQGGILQAENGMTFDRVKDFSNYGGTVLNRNGNLTLNVNSLRNESGSLESGGDLKAYLGHYSSDGSSRLVAQQTMSLSLSGGLDNDGLLGGSAGLTVEAASIQNGVHGHVLSDRGDVNLIASQGLIRNQGVVEERNADGRLILSAPIVRNEGTLLSAGSIGLNGTKDMVNSGTLYGVKGLTGQLSGTLDNSNGLLAVGGPEARLSAGRIVNTAGNIQALDGGLTLQAGQVDNRGGQIGAVTDLLVQGDRLLNQNGLLQAGGNLALGRHGAEIENTQGSMQAGHDVTIAAAHLVNNGGKILALGGDLTVNDAVDALGVRVADDQETALETGAGSLKAAGAVTLGLSGLKDDAHSVIASSKYLSISASSPLVVQGLLMGGQGVGLQSAGLSLAAGGQVVSSNGPLTLALGGTGLNNQGVIEAQGQDARLTVQSAGNIVTSGTLLSTGSMSLTGQGQLTNDGVVGTLGGDLIIQAQALHNQGKVASSGWLNGTVSGDIRNGGQIYGQKGQTLSGNRIDNSGGEISSGGDLTVQGQSLTNDDGRIISDAGHVVVRSADTVSNHGGLVQGLGDVTVVSGVFDNSQQGKILSTQGSVQLSTPQQSFDNHGGTIQAARNVQLTAAGLDNGRGGLINAVSGSVNLMAAGGNGMNVLHNEGGTIQANGDLHLSAQHLDNAGGQILQQSSTHGLFLDGGTGKLADVAVGPDGSVGTFQTKGSLSLAVTNLHGFGTLIAPQDLSVTTYTPDADTFFQAGRDVTVTVLGDYHVASGAGVLAGRNATVQASSIRSDGALMANGGTLTVHSGGDVYNTGLLYGATGLVTTLPGTLTNHQGAILTGNGSMVLSGPNGGTMSSLLNQSGQITAAGSDSDMDIVASRLTNDIVGGVVQKDTGEKSEWHYKRGEWQEKGRVARIPIPDGFLDEKGEQATGTLTMTVVNTTHRKGHRGEAEVTRQDIYTVANNAAPLLSAGRDIHVSAAGGVLNDGGHIAAGRDIALSGGTLQNVGYTNERIFRTRCEDHRGCIWATEGGTVPSFSHTDGYVSTGDRLGPFTWATFYLPGVSGTIAAGRNISGNLSGAIANQTRTAAGEQVQFSGRRPDGLKGKQLPKNGSSVAAVSAGTSGGIAQMQPDRAAPVMVTSSQAQPLSLPGFGGTTVAVSASGASTAAWKPMDQSSSSQALVGSAPVPHGAAGSLPSSSVRQINGGVLVGSPGPAMTSGGTLAGEAAVPHDGAGSLSPSSVHRTENGGTLAGVSDPSMTSGGTLEGKASVSHGEAAALSESSNPLMASGGRMTAGDVSRRSPVNTVLHVPSADLKAVVASIPGGGTLFVPNPSPSVHYLLETNPRYATFVGLYGSDYLLGRLGHSMGDYRFLGDSGFDTQYVQQQIVSATGQTFLGGSYQAANEQMQTLLDNASRQSDQLGLTFGQALTSDEQSRLTDNIVWYVPVSVNGQTVLVPKLYLAPGKVKLANGGVISAGNDLSLQGGSISNSGAVASGKALNLVATQGDLVNDGGSISGGDVTLASLAGSVVNDSQLRTDQIVGGTQQTLGQQGTITASGNARLSAAKDILFKGALLKAGGDATLVAGQNINLDALSTHGAGGVSRRHFTQTGSFVRNIGSSVMGDGTVTLAALGGDINLAGSGVMAGKDAFLQAKGNLALKAMTDGDHSYSRVVKKGFLNKKTVTTSKDSTTGIGSLVGANDNILMSAGGDLSVKGTVSGGQDVTLTSGGSLSVDAFQNTAASYYQKKKSGLSFHTGSRTSIGYGKSNNTDTGTGTNWTSSTVSAGRGDLTLKAGSAATITGSNLSAGHDIGIDASSVAFKTVEQTLKQTQDQKQFFVGVSVGLTSDSIVGQVVQSALAASKAKGQGSSMVAAMNGGQALYTLQQGADNLQHVGSLDAMNMALIGVEASVGFNKSKSHAVQDQSTVVGSAATAGNGLSIIARGDHPGAADDGSISATAARFSAKDITFDAKKDINLLAGWDHVNTYSKKTQTSASIGVKYEIGGPQTGFGVTAGASHQSQEQQSHQSTAVDTTLNGTNSVTLHSGARTLLNGAEVRAPRIDVKAAELEIISPQNTYDYRSVSTSAGVQVSVPLNNPAGAAGGASFQHQVVTDHFASTGKVLSGLYAGEQGVGIDVAGNTTLTAGVISSVASREKNHFSTGSLISRNLENVSRWQLESSGFQASFGGAGQGDATGWLGQVGQGMAANSMSLLGGGQNHNEKTTSHSAVGDNITINAKTVDGDLSRDVAHANGAIDNKFNAQKLQNQMQARTLGTQLVGEIVGTVFQKDQERDDKARAAEGLPPEEAGSAFSPREVARDLIEAGGAAGIAALTGGSPAAAGLGTLAGKVTAATTRPLAEAVATGLTGSSDGTLHDSIANMFSSAAAAAGGAVGGLVAGKGSASVSALTGAAAAAAIEQYNDSAHRGKEAEQKEEQQKEETKAVVDAVLDGALTAGSMIPGPPGTAFGYTLAGRLEQEGHPYLAAIQAGSAGLDTFGIDTSVVVSPAITGSLWLAKSAVVGAILKFGGDAFERLAQAQFMAVTGEEFGAALVGHAAEGAANLGKKETAAGQVVKSVRQDDPAFKNIGKNSSLSLEAIEASKGGNSDLEEIDRQFLEFNEKAAGKGIHDGKQGKHIVGHNDYIPGRSIMSSDVDPVELLEGALSRKYDFLGMGPRDSIYKFDFNKKIGEYTQGEGKFYDTTIGSIHVSKKGAHIVPAAPKGWENK